jgi:hypothetical protein
MCGDLEKMSAEGALHLDEVAPDDDGSTTEDE